MPTNVIMPALGVAQQTGTLLKWLKAEGQTVAKGEPLMEIETDKATVEIEAPASGVLAQVSAMPGDQIPVGQRIAFIIAAGESLLGETPPVSSARPPTPAKEPMAALFSKSASSENSGSRRSGRISASPAARRIAHETGINLALLKGSGPEGSILARDVLRAGMPEENQPVTDANGEIVPLGPMRRIIGERMVRSKQSAPHFYLSMDIDMTAVETLRGQWKSRAESPVPSINDFIVFACARALKEFPSINSTYTEEGSKRHGDINIGIAVALDEGLVVPVVRNADDLSLSELAAKSRELIDKAQTKKLFPLDYEGGTFTLSNLGMLGVDNFVAIINPPQCAILATGRVAPRVVVDNGMFAIRSMMTATLSADHRVVDGAIGARFLGKIKLELEKPAV